MAQEQRKLKERLEEINKFHKDIKNFAKERIEQEKKSLIETVEHKMKNNSDKINCYVERYVAWKLERGITIYEMTHEYDPHYDHSGILVHTNREMNKNSIETFRDFLEQYVGYSEASYISGIGLVYPDFETEIQEELILILKKIQYKTMREMFYGRKIDAIILDKLQYQEEKIETEEELDELFYEILEEMNWDIEYLFEDQVLYELPIYIENKKLYEIYKKHEFEMKKLATNLKEFHREYEDFIEKLREEAMTIIVEHKFEKKIEKNDKELLKELEMLYSKDELGLLCYFNILLCSNQLKLKFEKGIKRKIEEKEEELKKQYPFEIKYE